MSDQSEVTATPGERGAREPVTHELKVWPEFFAALLDGRKTFECRKDDRDYRVGDKLRLREWFPGSTQKGDARYTGFELTRTVSYIVRDARFGVADGYAVLGLAASSQGRERKVLNLREAWIEANPIAEIPHDDCLARFADKIAAPPAQPSEEGVSEAMKNVAQVAAGLTDDEMEVAYDHRDLERDNLNGHTCGCNCCVAYRRYRAALAAAPRRES